MYAEGKVATDRWYPIVMLESSDGKTPVTGILFSAVTVRYRRIGDATGWTSSYQPPTEEWMELGNGSYSLRMGLGEFTAGTGIYQVQVESGTALAFRFPVEVRSHLLEEHLDTIQESTSYPGGFIYFDSNGVENTNTVLGIDGTPANPVTTEGAAKTLADALGTKKIMISGTFTVGELMDGYEFCSSPGLMILDQNDQQLSACRFRELYIQGTATGLDPGNQYFDCTYADGCYVAGIIYRGNIEHSIRFIDSAELHQCFGAESAELIFTGLQDPPE